MGFVLSVCVCGLLGSLGVCVVVGVVGLLWWWLLLVVGVSRWWVAVAGGVRGVFGLFRATYPPLAHTQSVGRARDYTPRWCGGLVWVWLGVGVCVAVVFACRDFFLLCWILCCHCDAVPAPSARGGCPCLRWCCSVLTCLARAQSHLCDPLFRFSRLGSRCIFWQISRAVPSVLLLSGRSIAALSGLCSPRCLIGRRLRTVSTVVCLCLSVSEQSASALG